MPRIHKALMRSKNQWELWQELQVAIDNAPTVVPCTNFPDAFFGDSAAGAAMSDIRMAKQMCNLCPIRRECATYAIEADEEWGVWGGLSAQERKRYKRLHGSPRKAT